MTQTFSVYEWNSHIYFCETSRFIDSSTLVESARGQKRANTERERCIEWISFILTPVLVGFTERTLIYTAAINFQRESGLPSSGNVCCFYWQS